MRRLSISNDFTFGSGLAPSAPPLAGWPRPDPGLHGPFAPAPLQDLHRYYEPSRPCAPPRYSAARSVRRSRSSLSQPAGRLRPYHLAAVIGATGSPVPCQRLRRAHATSTPGTARAASRPPPAEGTPARRAFVPGVLRSPGFDAIVPPIDASAVVHTRSSSRHPPDPLTAGLFPQRSPPRLLTGAACGGLGSPPARRTRRTYLHHWHSTVRAGDLLHRHTPLSGHTADRRISTMAVASSSRAARLRSRARSSSLPNRDPPTAAPADRAL